MINFRLRHCDSAIITYQFPQEKKGKMTNTNSLINTIKL